MFSIVFLSLIKKEKISAISSDGVDIEYSVRNPWVFTKGDKFKRSVQVEHFAYLNSELLNFFHSSLIKKSNL